MYSNDLHNAYAYALERRKDEMREAAMSRLARQCSGDTRQPGNRLVIYGILMVICTGIGLAWYLS